MSFTSRIRRAIANPKIRLALDGNYTRWRERRTASLAALPHADEVRDHARAIRIETLQNLPRYLTQFEANVKAHGGVVHWASDAAEAQQIIADIIATTHPHGALIAKSKSMLSEEIHLNAHLEKLGHKIVETDLGEWIVQLRGETPSHLTAPAIHLRRDEVAETFRQHIGWGAGNDPTALTHAARDALRSTFLQADIGMSGVNFGVAETGTLCLVTNEGNGRLVTTIPKIHIALMGIERLAPSMRDVEILLRVLARSATGQPITAYTNFITGARRATDPDGPEQLHVVIIDNGRSRILKTDLAESLLCIRCGACASVCPVYRQIGGHAYNATYMGPIGAVLMPALQGEEKFGELAQASSLCGACQDVCPVRIDLPTMLLRVRHTHLEKTGGTRWLSPLMFGWAQVMRSPRWYLWGIKLTRFLARPLARAGWLQNLPPPLNGWTAQRDFPLFAPKTFREKFAERLK